MSGYIIIGIVATLVSTLVRNRMMSTMKKLSQVGTRSGLSGKEIAEKMLADNNIHDVQVLPAKGMLTDHYNPGNRTVNLSEAVFHERSVTAAAVAAHEVGHAVQHATAYPMLQFRSGIVPIVSISNRLSPLLIMGGLFLGALGSISQLILLIGIGLFAVSTLFSFVTLPVEFDASKRALAWIESSGISSGEEKELAEKGLKWAAMTYVVAALTSLAYLLYYLQFLNRR
ncbi:MAG: zinc metallopeptidase [Bacteroidota bacterium]